jgi:hypothetical protein
MQKGQKINFQVFVEENLLLLRFSPIKKLPINMLT